MGDTCCINSIPSSVRLLGLANPKEPEIQPWGDAFSRGIIFLPQADDTVSNAYHSRLPGIVSMGVATVGVGLLPRCHNSKVKLYNDGGRHRLP